MEAKLLGGPVLLGAGVTLPLWLDLAHAEAQVVGATCPSASAPQGSASIAVKPGVVKLAIGTMSDHSLNQFGALPAAVPTRLIDVLLLKVDAAGMVEIAQTAPVPLTFSSSDIVSGTIKTARVTTPITSLGSSLLGSLDPVVTVLGIGLSPVGVIKQAVRNLLMPLAPTLDLTISGALSTLGLGIGEADVRVYGVRCRGAVLVG